MGECSQAKLGRPCRFTRQDGKFGRLGVDEYELMEESRTLPFEKLVTMKLTSYRRKDQVHLLDMISIGLLDESWLEKLSPKLRARMEELLNDPDG